MHLPTLRQLQFLVALADNGSFSRAADACLVAQPTLSAAIKEIETLVGTPLVERSSRSSHLTNAGEVAVERARRILAETEELVTTARGAGAPLSGRFRLGAIPTIAPFILPGTVKQLRVEYPDLKLYLREDKTVNLLTALHARTLDAAIIALPWPTPGITTQKVASDSFLLACPAGHRLEDQGSLSPKDIEEEALLLLEEGHCMRSHALSACALQTSQNSDDLAATSLHTMLQMVAGGLGVSLIPEMAVRTGIAKGVGVSMIPFKGDAPGRDIAIAWRTGSIREAESHIIGKIITGVVA